jgi:hypothetical protein
VSDKLPWLRKRDCKIEVPPEIWFHNDGAAAHSRGKWNLDNVQIVAARAVAVCVKAELND